MANVTISGLSAAAALTGTEEVPVVQGVSTVRTTTQDIADLAAGGASYTSYVSEVSGDPTVSATVFENTTGLTFTWASGLNIDYTSYTTTISSVDPAKIAIFLTGEIILDFSKGITARYTTPSYLITTVNPTTATIEIVYDGIGFPATLGAPIMVEVRIYP